jgi:hypothetical protein
VKDRKKQRRVTVCMSERQYRWLKREVRRLNKEEWCDESMSSALCELLRSAMVCPGALGVSLSVEKRHGDVIDRAAAWHAGASLKP